jgi:ADP-ribose pyrophosphatase
MSELTEKTIASEPAYLGKLVKLYVDTVELPNGGTAKREVVRHPGAVAIPRGGGASAAGNPGGNAQSG